MAAVLILLLISSAATSGFAGILMMLGVFALFTGLYGFIFKRRSWAGFPSRKVAGLAGAGGLIVAMIGGGIAGPSTTATADAKNVGALADVATPTPTATETSPALTACTDEDATRQFQDEVFVCTVNRADKLVWLDKATSDTLLADRAAEKAAAEKAAAKKAAAEKAAAKKAAAEKAAKEKAAEEKAAAEEAAAEQAAAEQAAAEQAAEQAPAVVHPGAFCSGGTGVSSTGKPMVCAPASDGRNRWQSQ
ncbi:hypothetical protein [Arthrobacter mobilis]|uniref:hypothetical protein n=1 Tax=Arthrobacter mobilis TaxID=2724944 RepID=UPI00197B38B2|nr:hypothetical protein [Arthrobacter mobilis]